MFKEPSQPLHPDHPVLSKANLYPYFLEDAKNPACMLILPGGGYAHVSHQEGPPVAGWLNSIGISACVLEYTVGLEVYPDPQQQALYAMRYLRANAEALNIDPKRIGVIGFSAGGHLAGCVSQGYEREAWYLDPDQCLEGISARPDATILSYAVLSPKTLHKGSYKNLLGENRASDLIDSLAWDQCIHEDSAPVFLWHTANDDCVPVGNTYLVALALEEKSIPHEVHVYPEGAHGLGLVSIGHRREGASGQWKAQAERWLIDLGF